MTAPDPLATPQRIAFVGDVHMNASWSRSVIEYAADQRADVIVQLGDFGYVFRGRFVQGVERALEAAGLPMLFVDGNHEAFPILYRYPIRANGLREVGEHLWHIPRGFRWEWGGVRFLGCGGARSVDREWRVPGVSWWREEEITDEDVARCVEGGPADVLISHDCPSGVVIPGIDDRPLEDAPFPLADLLAAGEHRQKLQRIADAALPRWIWHGHYHRQYAALTHFVGAGGAGVVTGLDCDGSSLTRNVHIVDLSDIAATLLATGQDD